MDHEKPHKRINGECTAIVPIKENINYRKKGLLKKGYYKRDLIVIRIQYNSLDAPLDNILDSCIIRIISTIDTMFM